jgi:hypothetical protein
MGCLSGGVKDVDGPWELSYSSSVRKGLVPSIAAILIFYALREDADADPAGRR